MDNQYNSIKQELVVDETIPTTSQSVLLVKDDPSLAKYFKMLKMGVVEQAVKLKMISEGVNPLLLELLYISTNKYF
uniref:BTB domain-containing protein n=1 Tax=Heterorhabditis bacteriophora TaxID=37862 RepID=A0A1I7WW98_HETBA